MALLLLAALATATGCSGPGADGSSASGGPGASGAASASGGSGGPGAGVGGDTPQDPGAYWSTVVREENARTGTTAWGADAAYRARPGLAAFADRVSVRPGETVGLYVDGTGPVALAAYRIGAYGGTGGRLIWSGTAEATRQPAAATLTQPLAEVAGTKSTQANIAPWTMTAEIDTQGWPEGAYLLAVTSEQAGATRYVPLTLRSADARGRLLVVSSVLTYQAYNQWGGHSLYHGPDGSLAQRSRAVSFDRPYDQESGAGQFFAMDAPIVRAAEDAGLPLAWATDYDLAVDPGLVRGATGIVFGGHAEYWTPAERTAVIDAVAHGTNLASFGANTAYWRIRMAGAQAGPDSLAGRRDGRPRVVFASKNAAEDPLATKDPAGTTVKFRSPPKASHEAELAGVAYDCNPVRDDWVVSDASWWGFEGTGASAGSRLKGVVGNEIDRAYALSPGPGPGQVVAYGRVTCRGGTTAYTGLYTSTPSGAGIFAAGTLGWPGGLVSSDEPTRTLARAITRRILVEFAAPRAGQRHPARDTTGLYWLPRARTTSYGG